MKRILRVLLAAFTLVVMTAFFVAPAAWLVAWFGWLPRLQLVPAVLSASTVTLVVLAAVTLLFGRLYCAVMCPLGIVQDLVRFLARLCRIRTAAPAPRTRFSAISRLVILLLFAVALVCGFGWVIEPYSVYGRFLAYVVAGAGMPSAALVVFSAALMLAIAVGAVVTARLWCSEVCPVGAFLGLLSRFALFRVRIDRAKCVNCNRCVAACDKGAIGADAEKAIDYGRCVSCYGCARSCAKGALRFTPIFSRNNSGDGRKD